MLSDIPFKYESQACIFPKSQNQIFHVHHRYHVGSYKTATPDLTYPDAVALRLHLSHTYFPVVF